MRLDMRRLLRLAPTKIEAPAPGAQPPAPGTQCWCEIAFPGAPCSCVDYEPAPEIR